MVVSSVSPERWLTTAPQPASPAISLAASAPGGGPPPPLLRQAVGQLALGGDRGVVVEQLRDGGIEGDSDVLAGTVAGALHGAQDDLHGRPVRRQGRRGAAPVALAAA